MEKLYNHFRLGMHYENWEFQLENHQDLVIVDRYEIADIAIYGTEDKNLKLLEIALYFNADILVKVTASFHDVEENRRSYLTYGYEAYQKIE